MAVKPAFAKATLVKPAFAKATAGKQYTKDADKRVKKAA